MPAAYAHYRFGEEALALLPEEFAAAAKEKPDLYHFGVHGPDLLFYYKPLSQNRVNRLGHTSHERKGLDFFAQAAEAAREAGDKTAAMSYLSGVLCHFTLDRQCHPVVAEKEKTGASHSEIEASFDRFLMLRDGLDPTRHPLTGHLHPGQACARVIVDFYPPLTREEIFRAQKSMVYWLDFLTVPPGPRRKALLAGMGLLRISSLGELLIPEAQNPKCRDSDARLFRGYLSALELIKTLGPALLRHLRNGDPLGSGFDHTFGAV